MKTTNGVFIKLCLALSLVASHSVASAETIDIPEVVVSNGVIFSELMYAIAESVGEHGDAAYEDAEAFQSENGYENAMAAAHLCPTGTSWVRQIAGGWIAQCGDDYGNLVGTASLNGMKIEQ